MSMQIHSESFLAKRRLYTFLPLLVLPFITLLYWAIGIDLIAGDPSPDAKAGGLNKELPDPSSEKETGLGKLAYYNRALRDSAKRRDLLKSDPYRSSEAQPEKTSSQPGALLGLGAPLTSSASHKQSIAAALKQPAASQTRILRQLQTLDSVLAAPAQPGYAATAPALKPASAIPDEPSVNPGELARIQQLMSGLQDGQTDPDPELKELGSLLDKVLDIQHPERVSQRLESQNEIKRTDALSVSTASQQEPFSSAEVPNEISSTRIAQNGFFSLDEDVTAAADNAITAVIAQDQTLVPGAVIKLRLTVDIYIAGKLIPKGSFLYGLTSLGGERLLVKLESIRVENSLFPVNLSVYDLDGMEGIYVPGAISRDVAKQSMSQQIQSLSLGALDPSLGAQAASAGVQAEKSLLDGKNRLVQLTVRAGYELLLKDGSQRTF